MAQSIKAAFMSIDPTSPHHLFSVQGSYLSPSSTDVPTTFTVQDLRTTRSMLTRLVTASQDLPSSSGSQSQTRKTLVVILDFHVPEPPFLEYHKGLMYPGTYLSPGEVESSTALMSKMASPELLAVFKKQFDLPLRMFEHRPVPSSTGAQNGLGFLVGMKTSQDGKELVDRTNTNWVKAKGSLDTYAERCAAIG
jgi:acyl-CoA thioesterase